MDFLTSLCRSACLAFVAFGIGATTPLRAQAPDALPVVGIKVSRAETTEPSPLSRIAPAELVVYRDGDITGELEVFLAFEGTATPGIDYEALEKIARFKAGEAEIHLIIAPLEDSLVEGDETVAVELIAPPTDNLPTYTINSLASAAKVLIHDNDLGPQATIKIIDPQSGATIPAGMDVKITAEAIDPAGYISTLEFYLDGNLLDTSVITFVRAPDPGTPIYHTVVWKSPAAGKHEIIARGQDSRGVIVSSDPVVVVASESNQGDTLVSLVATDPQGTELPPFFDNIDPLEFEISRTGPTNSDLAVFISLHGTATQDTDYFDVPTSIIIPAGNPSAKFKVVPKSDLLAVVEPMETVGVRLEPSPMAGPLPGYGIDPARSWAAGVIYEQKPPEKPALELVFPDRGEGYETGQPITIVAASYSPNDSLSVDFYDGDKKIGSALTKIDPNKIEPLVIHSFIWTGAPAGEHILTARATLADGTQISSGAFLVVVKDSGVSAAYIKITEPGDGKTYAPGSSIQITAIAVDPDGYIPRVEFFANDERIGVSQLAFFRAPDPGTPIEHNFLWEKVPAGSYVLTVRSVDSQGRAVVSFPVKISVADDGGGTATAKIEITGPNSGAIFEPGSDIALSAVAVDLKGYISRLEFYANDSLVGVSEVLFVRAPDPGTPITHTYLWPNVPAGDYALTARATDAQGQPVTSPPVKISVTSVGSGGGGGTGGTDQVILMVEALDSLAAETTDKDAPDTATFIIRRIGGRKDVEVPVNFQLSGTAVNGVDYTALKEQTVIPSGSDSVNIVVQAIPDDLAEPDETVELTLLPVVCTAIFPPPPQCYLIAKSGAAQVIIRDHSTGAEDEVPLKVDIAPSSDPAKGAGAPAFAIRTDSSARGKACTLESSTDLKTWLPAAPVFLPGGQLTYMTEPGTDRQRYYRLRVQ